MTFHYLLNNSTHLEVLTTVTHAQKENGPFFSSSKSFASNESKFWYIQCVHEKKQPPKYNGVVFEILGKHH